MRDQDFDFSNSDFGDELPLFPSQSYRLLGMQGSLVSNRSDCLVTIEKGGVSHSYTVLLDNQCKPNGCIDFDLCKELKLDIEQCSGSIQLGDGSARPRFGVLKNPLSLTLHFPNTNLPPFTYHHRFEVVQNMTQFDSPPVVLGGPQLALYTQQLDLTQSRVFMDILLTDYGSLRQSFRSAVQSAQSGDSAPFDPLDMDMSSLEALQLQDDFADPDLIPIRPRVYSSDADYLQNADERNLVLNHPRLQALWAINEALDPTQPITFPEAEVKLTLKPDIDKDSLSRRQYPTPYKAIPFMRAQVQKWKGQDKLGIVKTNHGFVVNLPTVPVPKVSQGKVVPHQMRICVDPRTVNTELLHPDTFEIPNIRAQFQNLANKPYLGEFDMTDCFMQQPLHPDSQFIAITFEGTQYYFKCCPFGIRHLSSHTQRWVSSLFRDCKFVSPYVDNLFFASDTLEEHIEHACTILERCNRYNIRLKREAFRVCETNLYNLGHIVSAKGIAVDPDKVLSIQDWKLPATGKEMQSFLGMCGFIRNYIRHYGTLAAPLEAVKYDKTITWTDSLRLHFDTLKKAASSCPSLAFADFSKPFYIQCDSSNDGCGAVLFQSDDKDNPVVTDSNIVAICSKGFNKTQRSYSIYKKELFGLLYALRQFHNYIFLSPTVHVFTDHKPLTFAFTQEKLSPAIQQWIDVLLSYNLTITHIPGYSNEPSDALSRSWVNEYAGRKWGCPPNIVLKPADSSGPIRQSLRNAYLDSRDKPVYTPPEAERQDILRRYHERGHFGRDLMLAQLQYESIEWPNMRVDVQRYLQSCVECARYSKVRPSFKEAGYILSRRPFQHIEIDLCTSFPVAHDGSTALLVVVDVFSSFTFAIPIRDKKGATVAQHLFNLFAIFGWPEKLSSDNGPEFANDIVSAMNKLLSVDQRHAVAWNPAASGAVEKAVGIVSAVIKKLLRGATIFWPLYCPLAMSYVNSRIHSTSKTSPFEIMFNRQFRFPEQANFSASSSEQDGALEGTGSLDEWKQFQDKVNWVIYPLLYQTLSESKKAKAKRLDAARRQVSDSSFPVGASVMVRDKMPKDKLDAHYYGPFTILRRDANGNYAVKDHEGHVWEQKITPDRLKLHILRNASIDANPSAPPVDASQLANTSHDLATVKALLDHRSIDGSFRFEYRVLWADNEETWESAERFYDLQCIRDYWEKRIKDNQRKAKDNPSKRSRYNHPGLPLDQILKQNADDEAEPSQSQSNNQSSSSASLQLDAPINNDIPEPAASQDAVSALLPPISESNSLVPSISEGANAPISAQNQNNNNNNVDTGPVQPSKPKRIKLRRSAANAVYAPALALSSAPPDLHEQRAKLLEDLVDEIILTEGLVPAEDPPTLRRAFESDMETVIMLRGLPHSAIDIKKRVIEKLAEKWQEQQSSR